MQTRGPKFDSPEPVLTTTTKKCVVVYIYESKTREGETDKFLGLTGQPA